MKTLQAKHRADLGKIIDAVTWRMIIMCWVVAGIIIAALRL